jgi:hypothetical protein
VFKRLRVAILLYILLFVAAGQYLAHSRSTDWDAPLWVTIYPVNGDGRDSTGRRIDALERDDFAAVERFVAAEGARYGVRLEQPVRFQLERDPSISLPKLSGRPSLLGVVLFSLRLRWTAARAAWRSDLPSPDITLFAVYHDGRATPSLDGSLGLEHGLVAVANLFADPSASGSNQVVVAPELLPPLGATDKYEPTTNLPRFPDGYADPKAVPLLPQTRAELMGGRIPISADRAEIPRSLREVAIGAATAREIGWPIGAESADRATLSQSF